MNRLRHLLALLKAMDSKAAERVSHTGTSCTRGCHYCCRQMNIIMKLEADLIAEWLLRSDRDIQRLAIRLARSAKSMVKYEDLFDYFALGKDCVFLDDNKDCSIYEVRPSACRFYYAVSPSEECGRVTRESTVSAINMADLQALVFEACIDLDGFTWVSPLPLAVLDSLARISENTSIRKIRKRFPESDEWMRHRLINPLIGMTDEQRRLNRKAVMEVFGYGPKNA